MTQDTIDIEHLHRGTMRDLALADAARFGDDVYTMVFADYINEDMISATRVFQFSRQSSRHEFIRFMSWCIKHNRKVTVVPFSQY